MTYNEFLTGEHIRPISGFNGEYLITNKGRVFSTKTQQFIGFRSQGTANVHLSHKGKLKIFNVAKLLLETYPDVEFEASLVQSLRGVGKKSSDKPRGVYLNPHYKEDFKRPYYTEEHHIFVRELKDLKFKHKDISRLFESKFDMPLPQGCIYYILHHDAKRPSPKYRAVIKFKNTCISLGYTQTVEEAQNLYYIAFLKLRGFRPWD